MVQLGFGGGRTTGPATNRSMAGAPKPDTTADPNVVCDLRAAVQRIAHLITLQCVTSRLRPRCNRVSCVDPTQKHLLGSLVGSLSLWHASQLRVPRSACQALRTP